VERSPDELACRELVELITDYMEGRLSPTKHARFEAHLAECSGCRVYLDQMRSTLRVLGALNEQALAPEARARLLALFRGYSVG
jgi:predicted anti-sigma-YlaC factor YlaD